MAQWECLFSKIAADADISEKYKLVECIGIGFYRLHMFFPVSGSFSRIKLLGLLS